MQKDKGFTLVEVMIVAAIAGILIAVLVGSPGRDIQIPAAQEKSIQADKAKAAANSIHFTENAEIDNIKRRLELTSDPGLLGYIVLLNQAGQPILYTSVKGKVTSGGKRLTPPVKSWKIDRGSAFGTELGEAPSDEGTWGHSNPYIYFWDTNGAYHQWNGMYLYSDQPIRLSVKPLVVSVGDKVQEN